MIPAAKDALHEMLQTGDMFRYHSDDAPVSLLEAEFAELLGSRYAVAVSSCSAALFLSLRALQLPVDAKVLIPAFTFAAVPSAVVHANCRPVLCEIDETLRLDMGDFEAKLAGCQAVIISHMRGHTSDMDAIMTLCDAARVPVIEDAAHSLGTTWDGRNIGTLGRIGCFSFQSYKLVNGGEGGILITDDADIAARAVIMSGAYESNWSKHPAMGDELGRYEMELPLYNLRMSNLAAAVIRPQLPEVADRAAQGLANHDALAAVICAHPSMHVPSALAPEKRAPDSIQFLLDGLNEAQIQALITAANERGLKLSVFGLSQGNARAFWNWRFLGEPPALPKTRAALMRACDLRLPVDLSADEVARIGRRLIEAIDAVLERQAA